MDRAAGERIGRYIIDRRLGAGGMAEAYLTHQEGLAGFVKPVVVKVLHPWMSADPKSVELFMREARLGARLNHSNIVQIFDVGDDGGEPYIAMEYVDGLTLQRATKRCWGLNEGIPVDVALRIIAAAATGLHHAHTSTGADGSGLVHRDMSPDNIMIAQDGTVKLLGFGVARAAGNDATIGGAIKGKVPFMAPEQLTAGALDARTDLWALGVTLYWCLSGRRPFTGEGEHGVMRAILESTPVALGRHNPLVSPELNALVMSLLERDKAKRLPTAKALAEGLSELVKPTRTSPVAEFITRMREFDDDPPEKRRTTGGFPAVRLDEPVLDDVLPELPTQVAPIEPFLVDIQTSPTQRSGSNVFAERAKVDDETARALDLSPLEPSSSTVLALPRRAQLPVDPDITIDDGSITHLAELRARRPQPAATSAYVLAAVAAIAVVVALVVVALAVSR